jgi:tetratricopeptide (TPR) repeat protein
MARADWHANRDEPAAMLADVDDALAVANQAAGIDRKLISNINKQRAEAFVRLGRAADSVKAYALAVQDLRAAGTLNSTAGAWRLSNYSEALYLAGQTQRSAEVMQEALRIASGFGDVEAQVAIFREGLARYLADMGRIEEARILFEQALASVRARHDGMWQGVIALSGASAWCNPQDHVRATALLDEAEPLLRANLPPRSRVRPRLPMMRACVATALGQDALAGKALKQAIEEFDSASELSPQRIRARALLAEWTLLQGDAAEAGRSAAEAVQLARDLASGLPASQWLGLALLAQAKIKRQLGDADAKPIAAEALAQLAGAWGGDAPAYLAAEHEIGSR